MKYLLFTSTFLLQLAFSASASTIAEKLSAVADCKADINAAIESKGVTVGDAPLANYAGLIRSIPTGGGIDGEAVTNIVRDLAYERVPEIAVHSNRWAQITDPGRSLPSAYSGAVTNWVDGDLVLIYTNAAVAGSFTLDSAATVRILCVGGGGSGGFNNQNGNAGGGGAGGFLEVSNVVLAAGAYTVAVGAGGAATPAYGDQTGSSGGQSSVSVSGTQLVSADGGSGGQGGSVTKAGGASGAPTSWTGGGGGVNCGGGGAGSSGNGGWPSGVSGGGGGAGNTSDITGETVEYAGGGGGARGGAGQTTVYEGGAGAFGGGNGGSSYSVSGAQKFFPPTAGRAGSGSGGGGSAGGGSVSGGSGIVVVRFVRSPVRVVPYALTSDLDDATNAIWQVLGTVNALLESAINGGN